MQIFSKLSNVLIVTISTLLGLYVFEGCLVFFERVPYSIPSPPPWWQAKKSALPYDTRSEHLVIAEAVTRDPSVFPQVGPDRWISAADKDYFESRLQVLPLSYPAHSTSFCNESGTWVAYQTDHLGFRDLKPEAVQFGKHAKRIVIVGDSYAFGTCVKASESIGGVLQAMGFRVDSFALPGTSPMFHYATFVEYGIIQKPDYLVWHFFINDIRGLLGEMQNPIMRRYLDPSYRQEDLKRNSQLIERSKRQYFDTKIKEIINDLPEEKSKNGELIRWLGDTEQYLNHWRNQPIMRFLKLWRLRSRFLGQTLVPEPHGPFGTLNISPESRKLFLTYFDKVLENTRLIADSLDIKIIVSYQPVWESYINYSKSWDTMENEIRELVVSHGIPFVDAFENVNPHDMAKYYPFGFKYRLHSNALGYRRIAEAIKVAVNNSEAANLASVE